MDTETVTHDYTVTIPCPKLGDVWAVTLARNARLFRREFIVTLVESDPVDPTVRRFAYPCRSDRGDIEFVETKLSGTTKANGVNTTAPAVPIPASWISTEIAKNVAFWHPPDMTWNGREFVSKPDIKDAKKG